MAHSKSAKKRVKQNEKQRMLNKAEKSRMRTQTKKVVKLLQHSENVEEINNEVILAMKYYDVANKHGVIHEGQANRRKSRLQIKLNKFMEKQTQK